MAAGQGESLRPPRAPGPPRGDLGGGRAGRRATAASWERRGRRAAGVTLVPVGPPPARGHPQHGGAGAGAGGGGGSGETCPERGNFLKSRRLLVLRGDAGERTAWPGSAAARCAAAGGSSSYGRWRGAEQVRREALTGRRRGLVPEPSCRGGRGTAELPGGRGRCPGPATEQALRLVSG